jgi:GntR family transcriptional repressor for pyruvate dehydrogenase complex
MKTYTATRKAATEAAPVTGAKRPSVPRTFEDVVSQVRQMITGGALKAGDRLPSERELAVRLGVGRPALREALRWLEGAGLIDLRKGKTGGAFITAGNPSVMSDNMSDLLRLGSVTIEELFEARSGIQQAVIELACERITEDELHALETNVNLARRFEEEGKAKKRIEMNIEFHNLLARASRNPVLILMTQGLADALRYLVKEIGSELPATSMTARLRLIRALRAGDKVTANTALRTILDAAEPMYVELARRSKTAPVALATRRTWLGESPTRRKSAAVKSRSGNGRP